MLSSRSIPDDRETLLADIPRDGIDCDSCGKSNPSQQCRKCYTVYCCNNSECLRNLLTSHDCHDIAKMRSFLAGVVVENNDNDDTNTAQTVVSIKNAKNEGCGICLESQCINPIVLKGCQHVFCTNCLQEWHKMEKLKVECTCPLCRSPTDDAGETQGPLATAKLYGARARRIKEKLNNSNSSTSTTSTTQQQQEQMDDCCQKALQELEKVLSQDPSNVQALFTQAEIYIIHSQQPQCALDVLKDICRIDSHNRKKRTVVAKHLDHVQAAMDVGDTDEEERLLTIVQDIAGSQGEHLGKVLNTLVDILLMTAEAYQELGEWTVARDIYKDLLGLSSSSGTIMNTTSLLSENVPKWMYSLILAGVVHLFTFIFVHDDDESASLLLVRQISMTIICASLVYAIVSRLVSSSSLVSRTTTENDNDDDNDDEDEDDDDSSTSNIVLTNVLTIPKSLRTLSIPQERHCYMQLIRCYYEIGDNDDDDDNYDRAIRAGEYAIAMNRHFPGVYEYVAKAYRAKGNMQEAIQFMRRAVLYETPWDTENIAKQFKLLKELEEQEGRRRSGQ